MARHRSHSVAFKRLVAEEFLAGETLHGLAKRHDISRNLIRVWIAKYEAGAFDDHAKAADLHCRLPLYGREDPGSGLRPRGRQVTLILVLDRSLITTTARPQGKGALKRL